MKEKRRPHSINSKDAKLLFAPKKSDKCEIGNVYEENIDNKHTEVVCMRYAHWRNDRRYLQFVEISCCGSAYKLMWTDKRINELLTRIDD